MWMAVHIVQRTVDTLLTKGMHEKWLKIYGLRNVPAESCLELGRYTAAAAS
jgi:hypothetical protein